VHTSEKVAGGQSEAVSVAMGQSRQDQKHASCQASPGQDPHTSYSAAPKSRQTVCSSRAHNLQRMNTHTWHAAGPGAAHSKTVQKARPHRPSQHDDDQDASQRSTVHNARPHRPASTAMTRVQPSGAPCAKIVCIAPARTALARTQSNMHRAQSSSAPPSQHGDDKDIFQQSTVHEDRPHHPC